jgi:hypothetical protein
MQKIEAIYLYAIIILLNNLDYSLIDLKLHKFYIK